MSMGLGPIMAIYQAAPDEVSAQPRHRQHPKAARSGASVVMGGEMDEPESLGAIDIAAREKLDNLVFVVNCNLQRLERPGARQRQDHPGTRRDVPAARTGMC